MSSNEDWETPATGPRMADFPKSVHPYALTAQICAGDYKVTMTVVPDGAERWRYISEEKLIECFYKAIHRVNREITNDRASHNHTQEMISKLLAVVYNHNNCELQQKVRKIMIEYQCNKLGTLGTL